MGIRRLEILMLAPLCLAAAVAPAETQPFNGSVYLRSVASLDLTFVECKAPVHTVWVRVAIDEKEGNRGTLFLNANPSRFDEFGNALPGGVHPPNLELQCMLRFVKEAGNQRLYEVKGPRIKSRLAIVLVGKDLSNGRLLMRDSEGKVTRVIELIQPPEEACHPGCIPRGTLVRVPGGSRQIEELQEGDLVVAVDQDGTLSPHKLEGISITRNQLWEVVAERGRLLTTRSQPVALEAGGFRPAGELTPGDRIWCLQNDRRQVDVVRSTAATAREEQVFNLLLGDSTEFIASDFVVRGKPPVLP